MFIFEVSIAPQLTDNAALCVTVAVLAVLKFSIGGFQQIKSLCCSFFFCFCNRFMLLFNNWPWNLSFPQVYFIDECNIFQFVQFFFDSNFILVYFAVLQGVTHSQNHTWPNTSGRKNSFLLCRTLTRFSNPKEAQGAWCN